MGARGMSGHRSPFRLDVYGVVGTAGATYLVAILCDRKDEWAGSKKPAPTLYTATNSP
jgi:hypothetical protein